MEPPAPTEKCREIAALLSEYLNLELPPDACQEIETHLAGCTPCVEFAESLRQTVALCRKYRPGEMPGPIGDSARTRLQEAWQRMVAARSQNLTA